MKPQLDKIRAEAAWPAKRMWSGLELGEQKENARLTPIIEKLLRVIECQDAALTTACEEMNLASVRFDRGNHNGNFYGEQLDDGLKEVREAQAEVLRILEGS